MTFQWVYRDAVCRQSFGSTELSKLVLKGLLVNCHCFVFADRALFYRCFQRYFFKFSIAYFRNSCLFTGHARSIFRLFKLSRHSGKRYASDGFLVGMRKSSF
jgi:ribosomal protein S14